MNAERCSDCGYAYTGSAGFTTTEDAGHELKHLHDALVASADWSHHPERCITCRAADLELYGLTPLQRASALIRQARA